MAELSGELGFEIITVHVEHGIRGEEAISDAEFAESLSREYGIECIRFAYDIPAIAAETGQSEEEAGRIKRYESFNTVCRERGCNKIAVAHHGDDNAETMLFNLARGSGLTGLGGMRPVNGNIIRPLLCVSRQQIIDELKGMGQPYRTDSTNADTTYARNRIRNNVIPELREVNSAATANINDAMEMLREADDYIRSQAISLMRECIRYAKDAIFISIRELKAEHSLIQSYVVKLALEEICGNKKDITATHVGMVLELMEMESGKRSNLPYGACAIREYDEIRLARAFTRDEESPAEADIDVGRLLSGERIETVFGGSRMEFVIDQETGYDEIKLENPYTKFIDCDIIKSGLRVRHPQEGDYLVINDKGSQKKLTRYFIDEKVPQSMRPGINIIADGSHVLWVIGMRISSAAKVTDKTRNILRISILEDQNGR